MSLLCEKVGKGAKLDFLLEFCEFYNPQIYFGGDRIKHCTRPSVSPYSASDFLEAGNPQKLLIYQKIVLDKSN